MAAKAPSKAKFDIYENVTNSIIDALETAGEWSRPWALLDNDTAAPRNIEGRPYRGVNTILLWGSAIANGYTSGVWGTYKAWFKDRASTPDEIEAAIAAEARGEKPSGVGVARKNRDGAWRTSLRSVRKDEKSTLVTLWKPVNRKATAAEIADGKANKDGRIESLLLRYYNVFNAEQVEGYDAPEVEPLPEVERDEQAEAFFAAVGADVRHGGNSAHYVPAFDYIQLPVRDAFVDGEHYYATQAHEHGHWTGHESRLARDFRNRFGTEAYAAEELVAELTAAFLGAHLGFHAVTRDDHASYVKNWLRVLASDTKAIFTAASAAQKAADYLIAAASVGEVNAYNPTEAYVGAR